MKIENPSITSETEDKKITASSFNELYDAIKNISTIKGTQREYSAAELILKIERVRHGHRPINFITRSHGIREVVESLLQNDKIHQKYTEGNKAKKQ